MGIEFLYWEECPSHERALALLRASMQRLQIEVPIEIIRVETEEEAREQRFFGSPTIRINGQDIASPPEDMPPGLTCRAYRRRDGRISPLPPTELLEEALRAAISSFHAKERKSFDDSSPPGGRVH